MAIYGRTPRNQGRQRRPVSEANRKAANPIQKELSKKNAQLQLFFFDQMPRLAPEKRKKLEELLRNKRVLPKNGKLNDLEGIIARAARLSSDLRTEAGSGKPKHGIQAVQRGFLATQVRVAFAAISEARQKGII